MARKPVKKRRVARKPAKSKPFNPKFKLKIGLPDGDKFFVHPETIPAGVALQWVAVTVVGDADLSNLDWYLEGGWKPVPNQKKIGGQVLVWAPQALADEMKKKGVGRATQQRADARALFGMDGQNPSPYHGGFPMAGPHFIETKDYEGVPSDAPPIDVDVTLKIRVSARWQDAAAALGLEVAEYARRRLRMEDICLAWAGPRYDNARHQSGIYEPVQLFIKRID
jgi:hypothetical protein